MSTTEAAPARSRWIQSRGYRRAFVAGFGLLLVIKAVQGVFYKENDFSWHLDLGRSALSGTPYLTPTGDLFGHNYPPGRVLIDSALAMLPNTLARALVFACAVGVMLIMFRVWRILAGAVVLAPPEIDFAAATLAFVLLAPWVVRDLDDCGLQLLLLLFLTMAGHALWRGAAVASGAWLALAFTFKSTPLLFLPLLIWKRRWTEACAMIAFIVVFNAVAPALVWGPATARAALGHYGALVWKTVTLPDVTQNAMEPPDHRNQSLPFAIARYLQTFPAGHPLFIHTEFGRSECGTPQSPQPDPVLCRPHPMFVQFLDLPPATAKRTVGAVVAILALLLAWRMRRPWALRGLPAVAGHGAFAPEWAVACALAALLSPVAWHYHLTLFLPCAYLAIRDVLMFPSRTRAAALWIVVVLVWVLQRDPLPRQLAYVVMSYHEDVVALLILIVLALGMRRAAARSDATPDPAHTANTPRMP
jgi:hypothetical protein